MQLIRKVVRWRHNSAFLVSALVTLAGCGSMDRAAIPERADSAGIMIVESATPMWATDEAWSVAGPITSIGTIEGPPTSQLYRVRGVLRLDDGRIAVANGGSSEIRIYNLDGTWIRSIGGEGDGPAEFRHIRGLQLVPPDTLLVTDDRGPRITRVTLDGAVVESRRLASHNSPFKPPDHRLMDRRWLDLAFSPEIEGYQTRRNAYVSWSEDASATDTILAHDGHEYLIYMRHRGDQYIGRGAVVVPFGGRDITAIGPGRVAMSDGQEYNISVAEIDGREYRVRRTIERQRATQEQVARFISEYVSRYPAERQRQVREHFQRVTPSSFIPTHSTLVLDAMQNLWVENYRLPWDQDSPRTWSVFDGDGRWLGDLELPEGLSVYGIGEDYIAGVERDDLGVEYVRLYAINKR